MRDGAAQAGEALRVSRRHGHRDRHWASHRQENERLEDCEHKARSHPIIRPRRRNTPLHQQPLAYGLGGPRKTAFSEGREHARAEGDGSMMCVTSLHRQPSPALALRDSAKIRA